jgi:ATP synthase protein I
MSEKDTKSAPNRRNSSSPDGDDRLDERLEQLKSKLEEARPVDKYAKNGPNGGQVAGDRAGIGQAFRLSSEFIAGVVVGAGIGYLVDTFFGTSPWGMIVFFLLGFAAAVLNVMRAAGMVAESQMRLKPAQDMHNQQQDDESDGAAKK